MLEKKAKNDEISWRACVCIADRKHRHLVVETVSKSLKWKKFKVGHSFLREGIGDQEKHKWERRTKANSLTVEINWRTFEERGGERRSHHIYHMKGMSFEDNDHPQQKGRRHENQHWSVLFRFDWFKSMSHTDVPWTVKAWTNRMNESTHVSKIKALMMWNEHK